MAAKKDTVSASKPKRNRSKPKSGTTLVAPLVAAEVPDTPVTMEAHEDAVGLPADPQPARLDRLPPMPEGTVAPLMRLNRIELYAATALAADAYQGTLPGLAANRLLQDKRLFRTLIERTPVAATDGQLRLHLAGRLEHIHKGESAGLVWLREDVVVDDFLLAERLAEAWRWHDQIVLNDGHGQPVL